MHPAGAAVPLHARGLPSQVVPGDTAKVKLGWHGATPGVRYLGALRLAQGANPDTGATLGVTLLSVEPGIPQGIRGLQSASKAAMLRRR